MGLTYSINNWMFGVEWMDNCHRRIDGDKGVNSF